MDVFEVIKEVSSTPSRPVLGAAADASLVSPKQGEPTAVDGSDDAPEVEEAEPLEGTTEDAVRFARDSHSSPRLAEN